MIVSSGHGWLTTLADLSIILFMVTAADLSNAQTGGNPDPHVATAVATAEPVAIYRPEAGVEPFGTWLAAQPADKRQRVTVLVRYQDADPQMEMAAGLELVAQAEKAGRSSRLIVERGQRDEVVAMLTFDTGPQPMARTLLEKKDQDPKDRRALEERR